MNSVIRKIGNSEGVIIPKSILQRMGLKAGDPVFIYSDGNAIHMRPLEDTPEEFERKMEIARERTKKYTVAYRKIHG